MKASDPAIRRRAYELFLEGMGYKAAAKHLPVSSYTVRDWFRRFRAEGQDTLLAENRVRRRYARETIDKVLEMRAQGLSWSAIEESTRVPIGTMKNWAKKARGDLS